EKVKTGFGRRRAVIAAASAIVRLRRSAISVRLLRSASSTAWSIVSLAGAASGAAAPAARATAAEPETPNAIETRTRRGARRPPHRWIHKGMFFFYSGLWFKREADRARSHEGAFGPEDCA